MYDNYTSGLTARNDISGHSSRDPQPTFTSGYLTRSNLTAVTNWLRPAKTDMAYAGGIGIHPIFC